MRSAGSGWDWRQWSWKRWLVFALVVDVVIYVIGTLPHTAWTETASMFVAVFVNCTIYSFNRRRRLRGANPVR